MVAILAENNLLCHLSGEQMQLLNEAHIAALQLVSCAATSCSERPH